MRTLYHVVSFTETSGSFYMKAISIYTVPDRASAEAFTGKYFMTLVNILYKVLLIYRLISQ